jgi:hypothetical protein
MAEKQVVQLYKSDYLLPLISFVLITLFWMWLIYAFFADKAQNFGSEGTALKPCLLGQCVTDKVTGEKKCPPNPSIAYAYDPSIQDCQDVYFCAGENGYASQSDGSTNPTGYCQLDPTKDPSDFIRLPCRCLNDAYCADYILNYFSIASGSPYIDMQGQTFTLIQENNPYYNSKNIPTDYVDLGLRVANPQTSFCTVPMNWIYQSQPGCSYIPGATSSLVDSNGYYVGGNNTNYTGVNESQDKISDTLNEIIANATNCMQSNPCNFGVLSFITNDASGFSVTDIDKTPVACTVGSVCREPNQVSLYDTKYGGQLCRVPLPP